MKYKYCPDCGSKMTASRSADGWVETYHCDLGCHLRIEIAHGETMHAEPDKEKWIRESEPRKPREWHIVLDANGNVKWGYVYDLRFQAGDNCVRVREVIE